MNKTKRVSSRGFTLVELLLYVSVAAVMLLGLSIMLAAVLGARVKHNVVAEVDGQGTQAMQIIAQTIRNAEAILSPVAGESAASLTLDVFDPARDPTIFDFSDNAIRVKEGNGSAIPLISGRLVITDLIFRNLAKPNTPGIIRIEFVAVHLNPAGRSEYGYAKTFYGSASLR